MLKKLYLMRLFGLLSLFAVINNALFAAYPFAGAPITYDKSTMRLMGKMQSANMLGKEIKELEDKIATGPADVIELRVQLDLLKKKRHSLLSPGTMGTLIARGFAGSNWEFLDDVPVDSIPEGLAKGVAIRASKALGDVVGERIGGALESTIGTVADSLISGTIDTCSSAYRFLFCGSYEPFTIDKVRTWQKQIRDIFEDIEKLMKDGLKDSLRGHDMTLRQFDLEDKMGKLSLDQKNDGESKKEEKPEDPETVAFMQRSAWGNLVDGYVAQFERLIQEIDEASGYYKENAYEVFCARQIKDRLLKFGSILLKTTSLKDLDSSLESNKAMIPAFRKFVDNLFDRLGEALKPRTFGASKGAAAAWDQKMRAKKFRHAEEEEEEFPESFAK